MSNMLGAKILFNRLIKHNVKYVFGYPGGAILPVLNEFYDQNKIKYVLSKTELGGCFMAEGYSKITKTPGVAMVTSGPGALNTMTSLQNALSDGTSLIVLSGQVSTGVLGTDAFQEADVIKISHACTKWNNMIKDGNKINNTVDTAFKYMLDKRHGSVLLDLPKNVMSQSFNDYESQDLNNKLEISESIKSTIEPDEIIDMIRNSTRPVILAGQGIYQSDAIQELRALSNKYSIPVTTTLMGLGVFPEMNCYSLKMIGMHGSYYANMAVQNCDLLLNFGSRFDDRIIGDPSKFAPHAKIVHVDICARNINKVIKTKYYINDDCKKVLNKILDEESFNDVFNPYQNHSWMIQIYEWKKINFSFPKKKILQGREVISELNKLINYNMTDNFTIIADVGAHQMWAAQFIDYNYPRVKWVTSGGLGSMGFALPASIGVKIAMPNTNKKVICICGDGGFTMSFVEILTAIENKVNIKVLIINNSYQLMVKMWQEKFYNSRLVGVKMNNPEFDHVVNAMGCHAIKITSNHNLKEQLQYVLDYEDGPIIANIITDENECVLPMVSPGKALDDMIIDEEDKNIYSGDAPC
jgi:acetolactate synthase-1/2/3 large subunit